MKRVIRVVVFCMLSAGWCVAQYGNQEISGFVLDPHEAAVPHARISARHVGTGQVRTAESDGRGYYAFLDVEIGEYEISAEAPGFKQYVQTNVAVTVSGKVTVAIRLTVGSVQESVTVTSDALGVEAASGEIGREISGQQIADLQLNGRTFAELLALLPGVSTIYRTPLDLVTGATNSAQSVNGSRRSTLSWNVDGADNKDNGGQGNVFVRVNVDAIAEFKVLTSSYSAEYGQNAGAMVNMALKSGTKEFHGSPYGFFRGRSSNGGWNLGGPVYIPHRFNTARTKLFFFVSQDFLHMDPYVWTPISVPLMEQRGGDFSGAGQAVIDPAGGQPFPGNVVPVSRIDRNTRQLLANIPASNAFGKPYEYDFSYEIPTADHQFLQKVDYHINDRHQLAVHYLHDNFFQEQNQQALMLHDRNMPGFSASAKWSWSPGTRTVNQLQFSCSGYLTVDGNFRSNPLFNSDVTRRGEGIDNPMLYGHAWEIPDISIQGYNVPSVAARSWRQIERLFQWKDDFSRVAGRHILKFGVLALRSRKNQGNLTPMNGGFNFKTGHGLSSGNALADALLGNYNSYTEASDSSEGWFRFTQVEFYAQDNWKVSQRLSMNFGVRAQYMQPQYSVLQNDVVFDPAWYDPAAGSGDPLNGLVLGGTGFPRAAVERRPAWNDPAILRLFRGLPKETQSWQMPVAPRLGFAYDLTGIQRTVLRGGWGLFFERIQGSAYFDSINNPPFVGKTTLYSGNVESVGSVAAALLPADIASYPVHADIPTVQQFDLGIQHRVGRDLLLDVGYVGSTAWHLYRGILPNQLPLGTMLRAPQGANPNSLRPYAGLGGISQLITGANSNYNSLQVQVRKQMLTGGTFSLAYTWSRNITDATDFNTYPQDSYHFKNERGLSGYHRGQVLTGSYVYPLPLWRTGHRWYQRSFGNWQLSGVVLAETGLPIDITAPGDPAGIASTGGSLRPDVVGDWKAGGGTYDEWFNPAAFRTPAPGTFGNLGRGVLTGPGIVNWDVSMQKSFRIREHLSAHLRVECFNVLDHFSYWGVEGSMSSARFGQVTTTTDPRSVQTMLRLSF